MTSVEKVHEFLEELQSISDDEMQEHIPLPVPAAVLRMGLVGVTAQVPDDPAELDAFLTRVGDFCHSLRSDAVAA